MNRNNLLATVLIMLGVACGVGSTYATINPIQKAFRGDVRYIMIGLFIIVQISVFFLAMVKHYIEKEAPQHYLLVSRISNLLMVVSIVSTITFFNMNRHIVKEHAQSIKDIFNLVPYIQQLACYKWLVNITTNIIFTWSVCVLLDVMAIKLPPVGFDLMAGIKHKRRQRGIVGMMGAIVMHKPESWVKEKYKGIFGEEIVKQTEVKSDEAKKVVKQNKKIKTYKITEKRKTEIDNVLPFNITEKPSNNNVEQIRKHISLMSDGEIINVKQLKEKFCLTERAWQKVKKEVKEIKTIPGNKTIYSKQLKNDIK